MPLKRNCCYLSRGLYLSVIRNSPGLYFHLPIRLQGKGKDFEAGPGVKKQYLKNDGSLF